ncbi:hypothetical protein GLW08_10440 [Pontibacillus yanchengensis]|uniref:Uncharacterized protein n=1 Tax=Pontibacillus yanchengensis TaxID=462910 RepID=A0ACC7VII4_9BACI|nr:hypothetical protein [Pontibacillus yanchengensis]
MVVIGLILLGILVFIYVGVVLADKEKKEKRGYSSIIVGLKYIGGIAGLKEGEEIQIETMNDHLLLNEKHKLRLEQVKRVQYLSEDNLVEKQKSVIKRAIVGGLLLGPLAAIVGGISGVGKKESKETHHFLSLDYTDKNGEEQTAIFLAGFLAKGSSSDFIDDVHQKIGYVVPSSKDEKSLEI